MNTLFTPQRAWCQPESRDLRWAVIAPWCGIFRGLRLSKLVYKLAQAYCYFRHVCRPCTHRLVSVPTFKRTPPGPLCSLRPSPIRAPRSAQRPNRTETRAVPSVSCSKGIDRGRNEAGRLRNRQAIACEGFSSRRCSTGQNKARLGARQCACARSLAGVSRAGAMWGGWRLALTRGDMLSCTNREVGSCHW